LSKPLTKEFLLSRGKCCNNGCKNCPYIKEEKISDGIMKEIENLKEEDKIIKYSGTQWLTLAEVMLWQELQNIQHNNWLRENCSCKGDTNCLICNSLMKQ